MKRELEGEGELDDGLVEKLHGLTAAQKQRVVTMLEDDLWQARLGMRSYQQELLDRCKRENTIVVLGTGAGKTIVAAGMVRRCSIDEPDKLAVFLAPTVPLAEQQYEYLLRTTRLRIALLAGDVSTVPSVASKTPAEIWKSLRMYSVVVCTPQRFFDAIRCGASDVDESGQPRINSKLLSEVSIVVYDECHAAKKNHPYAMIARAVLLAKQGGAAVPKTLGLTASPAAGRTLGETLLAVLHLGSVLGASVATVDETENAELKESTVKADTTREPVEMDPAGEKLRDWLRSKMRAIEASRFGDEGCPVLFEHGSVEYQFTMAGMAERSSGNPDAQVGCLCLKVLNTALIVGDEISGKLALAEIKRIAGTLVTKYGRAGEMARERLLAMVNTWESTSGVNCELKERSPKCEKLLSILEAYRSDCGHDNSEGSAKLMVFVKLRHSAKLLSDVLRSVGWRSSEFVGHGGSGPANIMGTTKMSGKKQSVVRQMFNGGKVDILVATSVAEEGIDIAKCKAVVRLDVMHSVISVIQSRGRARARDAKFFVVYYAGPAEEERLATLHRQEGLVKAVVGIISSGIGGATEELGYPNDLTPTSLWNAVTKYTDTNASNVSAQDSLDCMMCLPFEEKRNLVIVSCNKLFHAEPELTFSKDHLGMYTCKLRAGHLCSLGGPCATDQAALTGAFVDAFTWLVKRDLHIPTKTVVSRAQSASHSPTPSLTPPMAPPLATTTNAGAMPVVPDTAKNVLQHYCVTHGLTTDYDTQGFGLEFSCVLRYGINEVISKKTSTKAEAEKDAALQACEQLWQGGLLKDIPWKLCGVVTPSLPPLPMAAKSELVPMEVDGGSSNNTRCLSEACAKNALQHWFVTATKDPTVVYQSTRAPDGQFISSVTIPANGNVRTEMTFTSDPRSKKVESTKHAALLACEWLTANANFQIPPSIISKVI